LSATPDSNSPDFAAILAAVVSPRPLAWISTRSANGVLNIAPFNSFTGLANYPPLVGLSFSQRHGEPKDTFANIEATGVFVINVVTRPLAERMNESARESADPTDDFARLGLTAASIDGVDIPRIGESPAALACRVESIVPLPPSKCQMVVARIVGAYLVEGYDPVVAETLASIGALRYATLIDPFTMPKTWS
jgi:flavin reductase (DIM6/NTAB) family NADH-FMN oxidoreductase RutF